MQPRQDWRLTASYAFVDLQLEPQGQDLNRGEFLEGATPRHQVGIRSLVDLPADLQFDAQFRSSSAIARQPQAVTGGAIAGYAELDLRLAWVGWRQLELSVVGRNLLHAHHPEFGAPAHRGEVSREVYGKVAWGF